MAIFDWQQKHGMILKVNTILSPILVSLIVLQGCVQKQVSRTDKYSESYASPLLEEKKAQGNVRTVSVRGVGANQREALEDAGRSAVSMVTGEIVVTETVVKNEKLIKDEIITASSGMVESITIVDRKILEGTVHVHALVEVSTDKLIANLKRHNVSINKIDKDEASILAALQGVRSTSRMDYKNLLQNLFIRGTENKALHVAEIVDVSVLNSMPLRPEGCSQEIAGCAGMPGGPGDMHEKWKSMDALGELMAINISFRTGLRKAFVDQLKWVLKKTARTQKDDQGQDVSIVKVGLESLNSYACGGYTGICIKDLMAGREQTYSVVSWQYKMLWKILYPVLSLHRETKIVIRAKDANGRILQQYAYYATGKNHRTGGYSWQHSSGPASEALSWRVPMYEYTKTWFGTSKRVLLGESQIKAPLAFSKVLTGAAFHWGVILDNADSLYSTNIYIPYNEFEKVKTFEVSLEG